MPTRAALAAVSCLSAFAVAQQTKVVPFGMDFVEGPSVYTYPFGRVDGGMQLLYDADQITLGQGVITGIRMRQSQLTAANQTCAAHTKNYRLTAYTVGQSASTMVADLATNVGGATGTVVFQGPLSLPSVDNITTFPAPFLIHIPFSTPYLFDGTQGNLLLLLETTDQGPVPGLYRIDAVVFRRTVVEGIVAPLDLQGCAGSGATVTITGNAAQTIVGGSITTGITASANGVFPFVLSAIAIDYQPLNLAVFGMVGCTSWIGGFEFQLALENPGGGYPNVVWNLPGNPALAGYPLFTQALGIAPSTLLPDCAVSNGLANRIGSNSNPVQKAMSAFRTATTWSIGNTGTFVPIVQFEGIFP